MFHQDFVPFMLRPTLLEERSDVPFRSKIFNVLSRLLVHDVITVDKTDNLTVRIFTEDCFLFVFRGLFFRNIITSVSNIEYVVA